MKGITIKENATGLIPVDDSPREYIDDGREVVSVSNKGYVTYSDGMTRPPRKYETAEELDAAIQAYYDNIQDKGKAPTLSGLQLSLGLHDKHSLETYARISKEYHEVIKKAYLRYVEYIESELMSRKTNCGGLIFTAKNRLGWRDMVEHTHTGEVKHSVIMIPQEASVDTFNGRAVN